MSHRLGVATVAARGHNHRMSCRNRLLAILWAFGAAACGGGSGASPAAADAAAVPGDAFDPDADIFIPCTGDPRADRYAPGMQKVAPKGQLAVTLLSSDPGPPIKGNNTFTVLVTDGSEVPQAGATLDVMPFMPDHGHGSPARPVAKPLPDAGKYTVTPLYLFMAGLWEITFNVTAPSGAKDAVVFRFCVEQ